MLTAIALTATLVIFFLWRRGRNIRHSEVKQEFSIAEEWLENSGIKSGTQSYSVYKQKNLVKNPGAYIIVGFAQTEVGPVGFVIEIIHGFGVVEGHFVSASAASYHGRSAQHARAVGASLIDVIVEHSNRILIS